MMRAWLAGWTNALREADASLSLAVRQLILCPHQEGTEILHLRKLHDYPRALRFRCDRCPHDLFIKRFGADLDVPEDIRQLRLDLERRCLELLWEKGVFNNDCNAPRVFGWVGAPHFALVEEFHSADELLTLFIRAAQNPGEDPDLGSAVAATARFLAALHQAPVASADREQLQDVTASYQAEPILKADRADAEPHRALRSLQEAWMGDDLFQQATNNSCLVHGGMTSVNLLYRAHPPRLTVIDFETLSLGTRYIDVGAFTAEVKTAFQLHAGDSLRAEPYISRFLEEYYAGSGLELSWSEFTWLQAYFMGQRLLFISEGRSFDNAMKRWLAQTARDVWDLIS